MSNIPRYACTRCGNDTPKKELTVKKAVFLEMGEGAKTKRSRVIQWLCPPCLKEDREWLRPKFQPPRVEKTVEGLRATA